MKDFEDLTDEELLALSDEQIKFYEKLCVAEQGVALPNPPALMEVPELPEKDAEFWRVNIGEVEVDFAHRGEAQQFADFIASLQPVLVTQTYDYWSGSYEHKYLKEKERTTATVNKVKSYSKQKHDTIASTLKAISKAKDNNTRENQRYEKETKAYNDTVASVREAIEEAQWRKSQLDRARARFEEYLELADGDRMKALAFFEKANYGYGAQIMQKVMDHYGISTVESEPAEPIKEGSQE